MEEFKVDKKVLLQLQQGLATRMIKLKQLISEIEENNPLLRSALGENDCKTIQRKVNDMKLGYEYAEANIGKLLDSLEEYSHRIDEIRLLLHDDGTMTKIH